jgi:hypothetical protein
VRRRKPAHPDTFLLTLHPDTFLLTLHPDTFLLTLHPDTFLLTLHPDTFLLLARRTQLRPLSTKLVRNLPRIPDHTPGALS